jgi:hypothetical protein
VLLIPSLAGVVFWPGLWADWGRDDYMQLAMARLVETPWAFFTTDHFHVPDSVFRPLGYVSFWLGQVLAGTNFQGHALFGFVLFAVIALALNAVQLQFGVRPLAALMATLLFVLHPVAVGTALWWSARFDVLALLFALIAVHQARRTILTWRARHLIVTLLALLAAALSKEVGLIGAAAVFVLFQHRAWTQRGDFWQAQRAGVLCVLVVLGFLAWRAAILGTGGSGLVGGEGLWVSLSQGLLRWLQLAPGYVGFQAQLAWPPGILVLLGLLLLIALLPLGKRTTPAVTGQESRLPLALVGLCLLLLPALLQAPIVRLNALELTAEISAVEAAMQSRLFFMSLVGLVVLVALGIDRILNRGSSLRQLALLIAGISVLTLLAGGSHQQARSYAETSHQNAELARQAMVIARAYDWPETLPCHLVIEGAELPSEWDVFVSMDSIIKALYPDLQAIDHCFIHADYPTFFHLIGSDHANADASPLAPRLHEGETLARRTIGGFTIVYLDGPETLSEEEQARLPRRRIQEIDPAEG